jgi:hypothetical protein
MRNFIMLIFLASLLSGCSNKEYDILEKTVKEINVDDSTLVTNEDIVVKVEDIEEFNVGDRIKVFIERRKNGSDFLPEEPKIEKVQKID